MAYINLVYCPMSSVCEFITGRVCLSAGFAACYLSLQIYCIDILRTDRRPQ